MLLVGITGTCKTVLAQALADRGVVRLSVDEEVHRLHGRYGVDYPEHEYFERERPVVDAVRQQLADELAVGRDVVLDHGLWQASRVTSSSHGSGQARSRVSRRGCGCLPLRDARARHHHPDGQSRSRRLFMSSSNRPYRFTCVQNSGASALRSASMSLSAYFGSARTSCISSVLTCTSADWSRCSASMLTS